MKTSLISSIKIENLFDLYTYRLPQEGSLSQAAIFYGDNGVGKSTILRLVFHLLSVANDKGHRTALLKSPFKSLEVELASGVILSGHLMVREQQRFLTLKIQKANKTLAIWEYCKEQELQPSFEEEGFSFIFSSGGKILRRSSSATKSNANDSIPRGNKAYLDVLREHVPSLFILNADRRLDSDSVSDPNDEMELRRMMRCDEPKRINELVARSREIALSQAMSSASKWVSRNAVLGANKGSMNVQRMFCTT